MLTVHRRPRRGPVVAGIAVAACTTGCFRDDGPGELSQGVSTTVPADSSSTTEVAPPTSTGESTGVSESTGAALPPGVAFRLSELNIIDPHFFLTDMNDPMKCSDVTGGLNTVVNVDIADGGFNLVIYFEELTPGAEMRLFQGECDDPGDGSAWSCYKKDGVQQTVFDTMQLSDGSCLEFDPAVFQTENLPDISDPPPPCVRTMPQDFSVAVSNSAGPLFLRGAQIVASPDSVDAPTEIPTGLLYGFLPRASAEDITVDIPLTGTVTVWSVIDVMCVADYPEQLPSVDVLDEDGTEIPGAWIAMNFKAERVVYTP